MLYVRQANIDDFHCEPGEIAQFRRAFNGHDRAGPFGQMARERGADRAFIGDGRRCDKSADDDRYETQREEQPNPETRQLCHYVSHVTQCIFSPGAETAKY